MEAKRGRKRPVRPSGPLQLRVIDERRDPPDIQKLAKLLISLTREQEPDQPGSHHTE